MGTDGGGADFVDVPEPSVPVEEILQFAASYNGYDLFAQDPGELERIAFPIYDHIRRHGVVPEWLRVDLARAVLFYAYRADYFSGGFGPYEPMRTLVEWIRRTTDGRVEHRVATGCPSTHTTRVETAPSAYTDTSEYSDDHTYRWWYERRWAEGPSLCFVGLNPSTGNTDGKPRPTLDRVVCWALREGCAAVAIVNLSAYRATKPADLLIAAVDIVGGRNDDVIRRSSATAATTLVAWGSNKIAAGRAAVVLPML